jgi:glycosyltransferase involved in cell wall biosynthesis
MASGERVICVSDTVRDYVLRHYPATDPARLRVIPRGIDPAQFPRRPHPDSAARTAFAGEHPALAGPGPLLLLPGRGTRLKGHADALQLLAALRVEAFPDARLWLPGAREPGREAYIAELEALAARLGVADAVVFSAPTARIAEAYAASDLVLQLSRKPEAFGRTVVEALAVGCPVLGWAHGGVGELLALQPQGAVVPFDAAALADAAISLLRVPPRVPDTIPYTLQAMQQATLELYAELAG